MSSLATLIVVTAVALGQPQEVPSNAGHLKPLSWLVGTWQTETSATEGIPGLLEKGDKIAMKITLGWGLKKNLLTARFTMSTGGKEVMSSRALHGWDRAKKEIVAYGFSSLGGRTEHVITLNGEGFTTKTTRVEPDGSIRKITAVIKTKGPDAFTVQNTEITLDGKRLPPEPVSEFKRVPSP